MWQDVSKLILYDKDRGNKVGSLKECYLNGIGVGVGDPQMMTLKAVNAIRHSDVICLPRKDKEQCMAYKIAKAAVYEIDEKEIYCYEKRRSKKRSSTQKTFANRQRNIKKKTSKKGCLCF